MRNRKKGCCSFLSGPNCGGVMVGMVGCGGTDGVPIGSTEGAAIFC